MKSSIIKYIIGAIIVFTIATYAIWSSDNNNGLSMPPLTDGTSFSSSSSTTGLFTKPNMHYKDGTYTGSIADAFYGQLQVVATITGGILTNVTLPVYPNETGHTISVSKYALPVLAREAIVAQSANVQIISGATQDSTAFQQSLGSALTQAQ